MKKTNKSRIKNTLNQTFRYLQGSIYFLKSILSERQFIYFSCVLVGASSALAVIVLKYFAHSVFRFTNYIDGILHLPYSNSILPIIGILMTVFVIRKFLNGSIEKGTAQIMIAVAKRSGMMPRKQMYAQIVTSSLTVGMGGSAGLESPITITGAAFGSNYAQTYKLNYKDRTLLLACGVAAGIAAAFNAPIAGVLFAIEVILADMSVSAFIPIMISSATGAIVSNMVIKEDILLSFKQQLTFDSSNIPYYVLTGILAGLVSVYHARMFRKIEHYFAKFEGNVYRKAMIGASLLAILIFFFPMLFGEGYESIKALSSDHPQMILDNSLLASFKSNQWILLLFVGCTMFIKVLATGLTLGSGGNGGNFAPSLFVGSYLGFVISKFVGLIGLKELPVSNFTVVGMAGVLSGLFHAPLTAIFLIAEITGGYGLMIPLLIVSSISFAISKNMEKHSMDIKSIADTGMVFTSDKDRNILSTIIAHKYIKNDILTLYPDQTTQDVVHIFSSTKQTFIPIINPDGSIFGIVNFDSVRPVVFNSFQTKFTPIKDLIETPVIVSYTDTTEVIIEAFETNHVENVLVQQDKKYIGFLNKSELLEVYRSSLSSMRIE
ncbi:chloride channel protein [Flavobacterium sp. HSC-61S13]|uniref:chloride channel protein n=1 Tax=Flavobacterium sp. HSC-61S13 TaxID=2910963 RepID=UPI00209EB235|nr:chloride channel protein [Flavobacterium sp. HSC-61S13]MCP1994293.1 CIC family chloride channel protein [Flavobacterium sp. HSC-61S13]